MSHLLRVSVSIGSPSHTLREKDALILKQDSAIRDLSLESVQVVLETNSTQTEVDDDGLWDVQVERSKCMEVVCYVLMMLALRLEGRDPALRLEKRAASDAVEALQRLRDVQELSRPADRECQSFL